MPEGSQEISLRLRLEFEQVLIFGIGLPLALAGMAALREEASAWYYVRVAVGPFLCGLFFLLSLARRLTIRGDELRIKTGPLRRGVSVRLSEVTRMKVDRLRVLLERPEQDLFVIELGWFRRSDGERLVQVLKERIPETSVSGGDGDG